jgi:peptidoglycan hydrolase-like protein with peptidoglycan-binding domain
MRRLINLLTAGAAAVAATLAVVSAGPAAADTRVMPGRFTGYAFDACQAPSQEAMDVWRERSPYWGIGIYTSGVNRYCDDQRYLSWSWVDEQSRKGWRLLPLHVGLQASCTGVDRWEKVNSDPADDYAKARAQGRAEAREAVQAAKDYGIAERSTLWYDLEAFDTSRTRCRESALSLVSAWTRTLHDLDYRSGFYSSASSGIRMLDSARADGGRGYTLPDRIWIADWNGRDDTRSEFVSDDGWKRNRVHQYRGDHDESYGGVRINIDSNFMDVGGGSRPGRAPAHCGVTLDFATYPPVERGDRGPHVAAAQCLLRQQGFYAGEVHGRFSAATARAARRFRDATTGLSEGSSVDRRTWTALVSAGSTPLMKYGSASNAVRRLQRALNAADPARLEVDGIFGATTRRATRTYQRDHGLPASGVVTDELWAKLQAGRR